jgi:hypothetical protein
MTSEIQRIPQGRCLIRALLPVQGSKAQDSFGGSRSAHSRGSQVSEEVEPVFGGQDGHQGSSLVKARVRAQGGDEEGAVFLLAERTVEKHILERRHERIGALIGAEDLAGLLAREDKESPRVVIENLQRYIDDASGKSPPYPIEETIAEIYRGMAHLPLYMMASKPTVDIYA